MGLTAAAIARWLERRSNSRFSGVRFRPLFIMLSVRSGLSTSGRPTVGRTNRRSFFYKFSLERHVPADHMLRPIDAALDSSTIRRTLAPYYAAGGRPSIGI
jgi:hypothetical protein